MKVKKVSADQLREKLTANFDASPVVKVVDETENTSNYHPYMINDNSEGVEEEGLKTAMKDFQPSQVARFL